MRYARTGSTVAHGRHSPAVARRGERRPEGRPEHAGLGDDAGDVGGRRDVERGVPRLCALGRDLLAAEARDLGVVALLDRDGVAVADGHVHRRERRGHVERDAVLLGEDADAVGADLVGRVAVGGDAVGADDDAVDLAAAHEVAGHVVGDQPVRDALDLELPGGEPGALEPGPRLVDPHGDVRVAGRGRTDHAERRAVAGRREGAGVAVREDAVAGLEQRGAVLADAQAAVDVVVVDGLRLLQQHRGHGRRRGGRAAAGERRLPGSPHLVQRPAQVDGGGPRGQQAARGLLERGPERGRIVRARSGRLGGRERDAAGRRDADRRRAADRHVADAVRDLTPGAAGDVALVLRQRELVDEDHLAGQDLDGAHAQARTAGPAALAGGHGPLACCPLLAHARSGLRCPGPRRRGTWPAPR